MPASKNPKLVPDNSGVLSIDSVASGTNFATAKLRLMDSDQARSSFTSLLAAMVSADELKELTTTEFDIIVAKISGEVMSNPAIHGILKARLSEALRQLRAK